MKLKLMRNRAEPNRVELSCDHAPLTITSSKKILYNHVSRQNAPPTHPIPSTHLPFEGHTHILMLAGRGAIEAYASCHRTKRTAANWQQRQQLLQKGRPPEWAPVSENLSIPGIPSIGHPISLSPLYTPGYHRIRGILRWGKFRFQRENYPFLGFILYLSYFFLDPCYKYACLENNSFMFIFKI